MGTWGMGSFENDNASDWLSDLDEATGLSLFDQAFEATEVQGYYLEAPECVRILQKRLGV